MKRATLVLLVGLCVLAAGLIAAEEAAKVRPVPEKLPAVERKGETVVKDTWDWPAAMIPVAKRFTGTEGMIVLLGDSNTYANQSTRWARAGQSAKGATDADKAILKWSHADDGQKDTNGWWLAAVDKPDGRSETAASGITTAQYIKGGFHNLPSLAEILKKHNPQVAIIMLGTNDAGGRKAEDVLNDMNTIVETCINNGTIPVITTLPPARGDKKHDDIKAFNAKYLSLASARGLPIIDLYGEMVSRQPEGKWDKTLIGGDGLHLTYDAADGPPTEENLKNCGYLLKCYLSVQKLTEIKAKVIDKK